MEGVCGDSVKLRALCGGLQTAEVGCTSWRRAPKARKVHAAAAVHEPRGSTQQEALTTRKPFTVCKDGV